MRTTLRQIVNRGLKEALKEENLVLESELERLTDYVLNNSRLELTEDDINLGNGNLLGVGRENKDKELTLAKILLFEFEKRTIEEIAGKKSWIWSLQSYSDLESLEDILEYRRHKKLKPVVIIDNKIISYEYEDSEEIHGFHNIGMSRIKWQQEMYSVTYETEGTVTEDKFNSKKDVEKYVLELVNKNTENINIEVRNLIENKGLGFYVSMRGRIYDSNSVEEEEERWLVWQEQEEDWDGFDDNFGLDLGDWNS